MTATLLIMVKRKRHFKVRASEPMGVSVHSGKSIKSTKNSAVQRHMLVYGNTVSFEKFSTFPNSSSDRPLLNKASESALSMLEPCSSA